MNIFVIATAVRREHGAAGSLASNCFIPSQPQPVTQEIDMFSGMDCRGSCWPYSTKEARMYQLDFEIFLSSFPNVGEICLSANARERWQ